MKRKRKIENENELVYTKKVQCKVLQKAETKREKETFLICCLIIITQVHITCRICLFFKLYVTIAPWYESDEMKTKTYNLCTRL